MDSQRGVAGRVITIFGSSRAQRGDVEYEAAKRLGALLAQRGWTVCNGGHEGTMEAAAWGAKEAGGQTIGVSIATYRPAVPNVWLDQDIVAETLFARLERLVTFGDGFVVLRGGIGTLLELALVWNLGQIPQFAQKPIIVVGPEWEQVLTSIRSWLPMHPWEAARWRRAAGVDEAVTLLDAAFAPMSDLTR
ncbi:MAG TPA: LOG family protein [Chloroflexota bacterium]|nr:LOG family protein [Chloroflexota bacterium]